MSYGTRAVRSSARRRPGRSWLGRRWDDRRLVGLKLVFLVVSRVMSLLRLSRRESWWKDAEILMLRHQLAVAERERPKACARLAWPDRAWLALLAGTVPAGRLAGMRLLVTPGTILRWHRDIVRRRWGRLSRRGRSGRPATHRKVRSAVLRLAREVRRGQVHPGRCPQVCRGCHRVDPGPRLRAGSHQGLPGNVLVPCLQDIRLTMTGPDHAHERMCQAAKSAGTWLPPPAKAGFRVW